MIEFKLSDNEIQQLTKEVANFDVILTALNEHSGIDFCIDEIEPSNIVSETTNSLT